MYPKPFPIGKICPADVLLSADIDENDRQNALATVLRELLLLEQFGLTDKQSAALEEVTAGSIDECNNII